MKKFFLGLGALLIAAPLFAQSPSLNSGNIPILGTTFNYMIADTDEVNGGASIKNVIWDFSQVIFANSSVQSMEYIHPDSTYYAQDFPTADLATKTIYKIGQFESPIFSYYRTRNSKMEFMGLVQSAGDIFKFIYDKPMVEYSIPMQYGDSIAGKYFTTFQASGGTFRHLGNYKVKADAFGTLKLNDTATFQNVLRIYTKISEVDSSGNVRFTTETERYMWFLPGQATPLLKIETIDTDLPGRKSGKTVMFNPTKITVEVDENTLPSNQITLTNDANMLYVKVHEQLLNTFRTISLYDNTGRKISSVNPALAISFDLNGLSRGVYFVHFEGDDFTFARKFIIE